MLRVLLDECLPHELRHHLSEFAVETATFAGFAGLSNGELLKAASERFDVMVTIDAGLPYQQALRNSAIAVVVLRTDSSRLESLLRGIEKLRAALRDLKHRSLVVVEI